MAGVNKAIILGNLGQEPELHEMESGKKVCRLNVATTRRWKSQQTGEQVEETEWHRISVWGAQAEACKKYLSKGRQVYVEGRLRTSSYMKDDIKRYSTEIVAEVVQFVGSKNDGAKDTEEPPVRNNQPAPPDDDDIPF